MKYAVVIFGCRVNQAESLAIEDGMARRFKASQASRTIRALTVDDGQSVVTGNYLKLRLDVRQPRNEWGHVRVADEGLGRILPSPELGAIS